MMMTKITKTIPISEHAIQQAIFDYLVGEGFLVLRLNSGRKGHVAFVRWQASGRAVQTSGASDLLALGASGQLFIIEIKKPGKTATPIQSDFLIEAEKRGAVAVTASSIDDLIRATAPRMRGEPKGTYGRNP